MSNVVERTANFGFALTRFNTPRWQDREWSNWRTVDTVLNSFLGISNIVGEWEPSTVYEVGQRVVDPDASTIFECLIQHTSGTGTFAQDRAANPTYWQQITSTPVYKGQWQPATYYNPGDYVFDDNRFGVYIVGVLSGATYGDDELGGYLITLIDGQSLVTTVEDLIEDAATLLVGHSTSPITVGTGTKTLTIEPNKGFAQAQRIRIANDDASKVMEGYVSSYNPSTGAMQALIDFTIGSSLGGVWTVSVAGERGAQGPTGAPGSGSGDVLGPATNTADHIATFDGTNSKTIKDGGNTIADLLDRANHTGTQAISTITDLQDELDAKIAASLLTTRGDIIYRNASAPARLAKGTQYQVLRQGANDPEWGAVPLNQAAAVSGTLPASNLPDATSSAKGISELATDGEAETGTDTTRTLTPANAAAVYIKKSLLTTRGDMIRRGAAAPERFALGASGTILGSDGTDPTWRTVSAVLDAAFGSTRGTILRRGASAWEALAKGTSGYVLTAGSDDPAWAEPPGIPSTYGAIGTYVLGMRTTGSTAVNPGSTLAGSSISPVGFSFDEGDSVTSGGSTVTDNIWTPSSGSALSGTWRCMGNLPAKDDAYGAWTLWLRIS